MNDKLMNSLFDNLENRFKLDKPVRLIELFAGIGAQAKALENLGIDFEHYRVCEIDKYAVASYNAIHGTNFEISDITKLSSNDLGIVDTNTYIYILTYSFPCQSLSIAGKQAGMVENSNTSSSLLWEVKRLLNECKELPQILLMENVPQVHSKKNIKEFKNWQDFLTSLGYTNYYQDLNAKDFGIPQSRNRCYMISILDKKHTYKFPQSIKLLSEYKDFLEERIDEKYYLSPALIKCFLTNHKNYPRREQFLSNMNSKIARTITTKAGSRPTDNFVFDISLVNGFHDEDLFSYHAVRKLTPKECFRLMGFDDEDCEKASKVNSNTQLYKQAGNSIVVNVLIEIFRQMF